MASVKDLLSGIHDRLSRVETLLGQGKVTPDEILADLQALRQMTQDLKDSPPLELAPFQKELLNLSTQLNALQQGLNNAQNGLKDAVKDVDKRQKALHNYTQTPKKK